MGKFGFTLTSLLLLVNVLGTLKLEKNLGLTGNLVFGASLIAGLFWLVTLVGVFSNKRWAWPLNTVLFSLSTANLLWVFTKLGSSFLLALTLSVNVFGLLVAMLASDLYQPESDDVVELETYDKDK